MNEVLSVTESSRGVFHPLDFGVDRLAAGIGDNVILSYLTIVGALGFLTAQVRDARTNSEPGITRRLLIDQRTVQVVRTTYQPGAVEPPGPHPFDVVIIPLTEGSADITVSGKPIPWKTGEAIYIPRGVLHTLANLRKTPVEFVSVRIP